MTLMPLRVEPFERTITTMRTSRMPSRRRSEMTPMSSRLRHGVGRAAWLALVMSSVAGVAPREMRAPWSTTYEQFYLQAKHTWQFRRAR